MTHFNQRWWAYQQKNQSELIHLSHEIRGSAAMFGFHELSNWAGQIEDICRQRLTQNLSWDLIRQGQDLIRPSNDSSASIVSIS
ncbi:MAG: Hpt domain-containing protein [Oligoflexus sp.]